MAIRIDLNKEAVTQALQQRIDSLTRAKTKALNPLMTEIYEKEIAALTTAKNTLTEIK